MTVFTTVQNCEVEQKPYFHPVRLRKNSEATFLCLEANKPQKRVHHICGFEAHHKKYRKPKLKENLQCTVLHSFVLILSL